MSNFEDDFYRFLCHFSSLKSTESHNSVNFYDKSMKLAVNLSYRRVLSDVDHFDFSAISRGIPHFCYAATMEK